MQTKFIKRAMDCRVTRAALLNLDIEIQQKRDADLDVEEPHKRHHHSLMVKRR